jgi:hypothetical protein
LPQLQLTVTVLVVFLADPALHNDLSRVSGESGGGSGKPGRWDLGPLFI